MENDTIEPEVNLIWVGLIVEGGMAMVALLLGWFGFFDHHQSLNEIGLPQWVYGFTWGVIATLPMLIGLAAIHYCPIRFLEPMKKFVDEKLHPLFRGSSTFELLLLSLLAGFGEELLFRWCLQGGLTTALTPWAGAHAATLIGLLIASALFGLCHWINVSYAVTTFVIGLFLGLTMIWSGSFLVPAIAHALYDFIALIYIVKSGEVKPTL